MSRQRSWLIAPASGEGCQTVGWTNGGRRRHWSWFDVRVDESMLIAQPVTEVGLTATRDTTDDDSHARKQSSSLV